MEKSFDELYQEIKESLDEVKRGIEKLGEEMEPWYLAFKDAGLIKGDSNG